MKDKTFLKITVCFMAVIFVFLFGEAFIKDAYRELFVMEPGFKNLIQVKLIVNEKNGRGVIVDVNDERVLILTAKHLVSDSLYPIVEFGDYHLANGTVTYFYYDMDAALVSVPKDEKMSDYLHAPVICNAYEYSTTEECVEVYYGDNIEDANLSFLTGTLSDKDAKVGLEQNVGLFKGKVVGGMSGEGVFDEKGRLLGIIVATDDIYGAFIPAYKLAEEVDFNE